MDEELSDAGEEYREETGRSHAVLHDGPTIRIHDKPNDPPDVFAGSRLDTQSS